MDAPARSVLLEVGFEGIDCDRYSLNTHGPGGPAQERAPDGFDVNSGDRVATYYLFAQHCRSALLGGTELEEDVWVAVLLVQATPPDGSPVQLNGLVLEAFTDWPLLRDAWAVEGLTGELAEFQRIEGPVAPGFSLRTDGTFYEAQPLAGVDEEAERGTLAWRLYAGNGTTVFDYIVGRTQDQFLPHATLLTVQGGFLSEFAKGHHEAVLVLGKGSLVLKNTPGQQG